MQEIRDIFYLQLIGSTLNNRNHSQAAPSPLDSVLQATIGRAAEHWV